MPPIREKLGDVEHIIISPDSQLNLIPFAALVDENNQYLIENYQITYLTTGRDLMRLQNEYLYHQSPVIVANPNYDRPGTSTTVNVATTRGSHQLSAAFQMSLWLVSDAGTKELMIKYYQRLIKNQGRSEALRETQLEMLDSQDYQHPYYWAAFVPIGDWTPMEH